jgi:3'-5' exoribonuclease
VRTRLNTIGPELMNSDILITLLLTEIKVKADKNRKRYADLQVQDDTMQMDVRLWEYDSQETVLQKMEMPAIVDCLLTVGEYQGKIQLTARSCVPTTARDIRIDQLVQSSSWDPERMKTWLREFFEFIHSSHIRELIQRMIFEPPYYDRYCTFPAARKVHHNYRCGMLHHTLEVLKYAKMIAKTKNLSDIQQDRLLAMAFLHDWAKIIEYEPLPAGGMTTEGRMLGHIFIGAHHTQNVINRIEGFDHDDALIILNGILSHHGSLEWGSPVLPKTVEAQILHQADKMSADIESIMSFMEAQKNQPGDFTEKLWNMGTDFYKGGKS